MKYFLIFYGYLLCTKAKLDGTLKSTPFESTTFAERITLHEYWWDYSNPNSWSADFPTCGGLAQSPVNIATDRTDSHRCPPEPITFVGYDKLLNNRSVRITNNGHTVAVAPMRIYENIGIKGGGYNTFYTFQHLHFHWGKDLTQGSEHSIDNVHFSMEMHLVHQMLQDITDEEPITVVLSVLFQVKQEDNPNFDVVTDLLQLIPNKGQQTYLKKGLKLLSLLPEQLNHYYQYCGSLTTPPCTEGVQWTIFANPIPIGEQQIQKFRTLFSNYPKSSVNNFRPLQKLNGRQILEVTNRCW